MKHTDTFSKLDQIKKAIIEENKLVGCISTRFETASDGGNLMCSILSTDLNGEKIDGHIYKSFDKKLKPCFIARYYDDI